MEVNSDAHEEVDVDHGPDLSAQTEKQEEQSKSGGQFYSPSDRLTEILTDIQNEVMASENKSGCLIEPSEEEWKAELVRKHDQFLRRTDRANSAGSGKSTVKSKRRPSSPLKRSSGGQCTLSPKTLKSSDKLHDERKYTTVVPESRRKVKAVQDTAEDDLCSLISAEQYVQFRLMPVMEGFMESLPRLHFIWSACHVFFLFGSMVTGVMGIMRLVELMPIMISAMSALESVISFEQLQLKLMTTNQALQTLQKLMIWWSGLSMVEQRKVNNKEHLISQTEAVANIDATIFGTALLASHPPQGERRGVGGGADQQHAGPS
jgi:hypothetical protein